MENCTQVESTTTLYKPCLHGSDGGCVDVRNGDNSNNNNKDSLNRDSLQGGELMSVDQCQKIQKTDDSQLVGNADVAVGGDAGATMGTGVVNGVKAVEQTAGKRRRGRPPRSQGRSSSTGPPPTQRKTNDDEEDVCFICFDGGSLVLCDRRGCPKAYHPACIKREEAFFKSKAKWNCGWHICSTCQKASYYMCYTCTYSLCKNCTKGADYVNVRGNKGFCGMCMRTIMLIENTSLGNKEMVQVDFDDKTSWEYLFKVYWILLKEKLSLSLDELIKAKNPWKDTAIPKGEPSVELYNYTTGSNMEMSCGDLGAGNSKRRKTITQPKFLNRVESPEAGKLGVIKGMPLPEGTNWATKELLEFVAHMRNGDMSMISRFDVQGLLLEYIKRSNLRDPHQKSYVVCDSRLIRLFRKGRVGHFEMLKLLDSHFIIQDHSRAIDTIRSESTDAVATQLAVDGNNDSQAVIANDKRRKTRKKADEKGQQANPDEFAAVDVHNMNLIYLKRNLVENLIDGTDKFNEKVIGSFVRIRVPCSDQKQDFYRLVLVTGISKVAEPYKLGERTINVMLEIVNLDRKEVISIDGISDQEFSEDECQRLQQSIKCGLIKWFTVGEILEKATALQAARVNEWLESEILRVKNLRDRANEKGLTKELRECVEKLQLLNSPEERQRRLHEIPEVHCDPNMNLYCKSEDAVEELNEKRKGMNEKEPSFPQKGGDVLRDAGSIEHSIPPHSAVMDPIVENTETDKIWHYQDPAGKIQGPFSMTMLRKWSEAGLFPPDLRIWRASGKQDNSMLLVDTMNSQYCQEQVLFHDSYVSNECARAGDMGDKKVEGSSNSKQNNTSDHYCGSSAPAKNEELCPQSSSSTSPVDAVNSNAVQRGSPLPQWDPVKGGNDLSDQPQVSSSLPSSAVPGKPYATQSHQVSEGHGVDKWDSGSIGTNENLNKTSDSQPIAGNVKQDDTEGNSGKTCGESWKCPPLNDSSNGWGSSSGLISLAKALEAAELNQDMNFPDLHNSKSKLSGEDSKGQATESRQSVSSNVPHRDSGPSWSTTSSLVGSGPQLRELAGEWASSSSVKPSAEEWNSNLVPESSLKRTDLATDHAATSTSGSGHSSPPDPDNNATGWDPIVPEPNEYSLGDESVSDLLAEVEAMESLNGLASPTSILHCDGAQGSEPDCFSPVGGLSSAAPDMGKSDALSSTNDLPMHSRSAVTIELFGLSQSEVLDAQKSSGGHSSPSAEMDEDARPTDVSVNQYEAGSDIQHPAPPVTSWGMANVDTWRAGPQTAGTNWGAVQGNANFSWGGLGQGTMNVGYGVGQGTLQENGSYNSGSSAGNPSYWGSQQRYASPRERDFQGRDSSFGRGRSSWNRQSSYGGPPNGAASFRPPPKGQRVCKFYESGYCKKGASCSYWHP